MQINHYLITTENQTSKSIDSINLEKKGVTEPVAEIFQKKGSDYNNNNKKI